MFRVRSEYSVHNLGLVLVVHLQRRFGKSCVWFDGTVGTGLSPELGT